MTMNDLQTSIDTIVLAVSIARVLLTDLTDNHFDIDSTPSRLVFGSIPRCDSPYETRDELHAAAIDLCALVDAVCAVDVYAIRANRTFAENDDLCEIDDHDPHEINFSADFMCLVADLRECLNSDRLFDAVDAPDFTVYAT